MVLRYDFLEKCLSMEFFSEILGSMFVKQPKIDVERTRWLSVHL